LLSTKAVENSWNLGAVKSEPLASRPGVRPA